VENGRTDFVSLNLIFNSKTMSLVGYRKVILYTKFKHLGVQLFLSYNDNNNGVCDLRRMTSVLVMCGTVI